MTKFRDGDGTGAPSRAAVPEVADPAARRVRANAGNASRKPAATKTGRGGSKAPKPAKVKRRLRKASADGGAGEVPAASEETLITAAQQRETRKLLREQQQALVKQEREFGRRLVSTLTEGQNALNIAFGAILSAYIGTVLAAIDDKPFNQWTLAGFFVLIGVFIGGLCIGNLVVLRKHFGLGLGFLATGAVAAAMSLDAARALGFELPILKVMYVCWYAMLVATDGLLTAIVFFHHRQVVRREALLAQAARAGAA